MKRASPKAGPVHLMVVGGGLEPIEETHLPAVLSDYSRKNHRICYADSFPSPDWADSLTAS